MKKFFFLSVLACIAISGLSQTRFGLFAGPQTSTSKYSVRGISQPTSNKIGFHAGAGWKIPFENNLYFTPAAFYSLKGYKVRFNQRAFPPDTLATNNNTSIHTVELAFLLHYDFTNGGNHFFVKAGPSLDFQLFGRERFSLVNATTIDRDMRFGFAEYGRYSASMLLQFGYETSSGLVISTQYTYGMGSINNADNGPRIRHRVFGLVLGKYLAPKK